MKNNWIKIEQGFVLVSNDKINIEDYYISFETNYEIPQYVLYNLTTKTNGKNPLKVIKSTFPLDGLEEVTLDDMFDDLANLYYFLHAATCMYSDEELKYCERDYKEGLKKAFEILNYEGRIN